MTPALWIALCGGLVVLFAGLFAYWLRCLNLSLRVEGQADPSGRWVVAGGAQWGLFALSGVGAKGVQGFLQLHLLKWVLGKWQVAELWERLVSASEKPSKPMPPWLKRRVDALKEYVLTRGNPEELVLLGLEGHPAFQVRKLEADIEYAIADVAIMGQILGAVYVLHGMLPPQIGLYPTPLWNEPEHVKIVVNGQFELRPWTGLWAATKAVWRHRRLRRPAPKAREQIADNHQILPPAEGDSDIN